LKIISILSPNYGLDVIAARTPFDLGCLTTCFNRSGDGAEWDSPLKPKTAT